MKLFPRYINLQRTMWLQVQYICFVCLIIGTLNVCSVKSIVGPTTKAPGNNSKEWDWSRCREETVSEDRNIYGMQLHPLASVGAGGDGEDKKLRLGFNGDGLLSIYLSREPVLDNTHGLYTKFDIRAPGRASMYLHEGNAGAMLAEIPVLSRSSYSQFTRVVLTVAKDGWVELRVGYESHSMKIRIPQLTQMKYFGFTYFLYAEGPGTIKYGC